VEKLCKSCGQVKPHVDFPRDATRRDGRHPYCKDCKYPMQQDWADRNPKAAAKAKAKYQRKYPDRHQRSVDKWIATNGKKVAAHAAVKKALAAGTLTKEPCPCGALEVEAHHDDYDKPLDVKWRCTDCHRPQYHRKTPNKIGRQRKHG
jgi:hypothetical protein